MNIYFGVQATGNGHISRCRELVSKLEQHGANVDVLLSGRGRYCGEIIPEFGRYDYREGLTLHSEDGKVNFAKSVYKNNFHRYRRDIKALDVSSYDLILTDFEPLSARAARRAGKPVISISNQNSLLYPKIGDRLKAIDKTFLKKFIPADQYIGLFYHHFGQPVLPPIMYLAEKIDRRAPDGRLLVYLPFEHPVSISKALLGLDASFDIFHPSVRSPTVQDNCNWWPISMDKFSERFSHSEKVICNAGFGLTSEALNANLELLVKPVARQPEQLANAAALEKQNLAAVELGELTNTSVERFISEGVPGKPEVQYPDVASGVARELVNEGRIDLNKLSKELWS
ncbi:MAG: glycosyltransferase [Porticoccaceae bacterium]|nr:glycosyltransferase [Porticoccaceae bacterium]